MMRMLLAAALLAAATPALADFTSGTVYAYDEKQGLIVMTDRTIWPISANTIVPDTIEVGDKILIEFTNAGDDGIASVDKISQEQ